MASRAISLMFFALVGAGCAFDPGGGRGRGGGGDPDAGRRDVDAAPGGAPDSAPGTPDGSTTAGVDADPSVEVLVDTLTIPAVGTEVDSDVALLAGVTYRLVASGIVTVSNSSGGWSADAEYFWENDQASTVYDGQGGDPPLDVGLAIDDNDIDAPKTPDWGPPRSDHTYDALWPGDGSKITAQFHEGNWDNNSGELTLEIYQTAL